MFKRAEVEPKSYSRCEVLPKIVGRDSLLRRGAYLGAVKIFDLVSLQTPVLGKQIHRQIMGWQIGILHEMIVNTPVLEYRFKYALAEMYASLGMSVESFEQFEEALFEHPRKGNNADFRKYVNSYLDGYELLPISMKAGGTNRRKWTENCQLRFQEMFLP